MMDQVEKHAVCAWQRIMFYLVHPNVNLLERTRRGRPASGFGDRRSSRGRPRVQHIDDVFADPRIWGHFELEADRELQIFHDDGMSTTQISTKSQ